MVVVDDEKVCYGGGSGGGKLVRVVMEVEKVG
jgi:hypothetical protein